MKIITGLFALLLTSSAWATNDAVWSPLPSKASDPKDNPTTTAKVELGKMLYFDPRFSGWAKKELSRADVERSEGRVRAAVEAVLERFPPS